MFEFDSLGVAVDEVYKLSKNNPTTVVDLAVVINLNQPNRFYAGRNGDLPVGAITLTSYLSGEEQ